VAQPRAGGTAAQATGPEARHLTGRVRAPRLTLVLLRVWGRPPGGECRRFASPADRNRSTVAAAAAAAGAALAVAAAYGSAAYYG
jgi:hypothetical protein